MTQYYTQDGQEIFLKQRLDMGGEGAVWLTHLSETLAKIYHQVDGASVEKIRHMVAHPPHDPMESKGHRAIAWPQALLFDDKGFFQGFLMPRVSGALQLNHIYNAKLRRISAPGFTWHYLHVTAMNVASIMAALHAKGYVVGDLKTDNFLVTDRALVSIIDTDSFQIKTQDHLFSCPVGSEGFTPPELLGVDLGSVERHPFQDDFGLAILIHLLLLGYHPFSSGFSDQNFIPPLSRDEAIAQGFSLYSRGFSGVLPPYVIGKQALHPAIQDAFMQCFNEGLKDSSQRPTAETWKTILQSVLGEIKQCERAMQHFYFGDFCFWCDRLEKTGVDVFSEGHHVRTLNVDFRFQKAIDTEDLREISRLWQMHMDLQNNPRFQKHETFIRRAIAYVTALDQFKDVCEHAINDGEILSWWLEHEALAYFPHNPHERINNRLVHEFLKDLRERTHAMDLLQQAIQNASQVDQFGAPHVEESLEQGIVNAWSAYRWPESFVLKHETVFQRVEDAKNNLKVWHFFNLAYAQGDDKKLLALWEAERLTLEKFSRTGDQKQALTMAEKMAKKVEEAQNIIKNEDNQGILLGWWEKNPLFHRSFFRHEMVSGLSIDHHVQRAERSLTLLKDIQEASNRGDFQALSTLWDPKLCEGHKAFSSFAPLVARAQEIYGTWEKVKRAILEDENAVVINYWDEEHFAMPAKTAGLAVRVKTIFKSAYANTQFPTLKILTMENHKHFIQLRWHWPTLLSSASLCVVGISPQKQSSIQEKKAFRTLYTVKRRGSIGSALIPNYYLKTDKIQVWAAQKICGELLTFGEPLILETQPVKQVFYKMHLRKFVWRGWIKKFGPRMDIKFYATESLVLPSLQIKAVQDRMPIHHDDRATLVCSIPPFKLDPRKEKTLSFFLEGDIIAQQYRIEGSGLDGVDLICRSQGGS